MRLPAISLFVMLSLAACGTDVDVRARSGSRPLATEAPTTATHSPPTDCESQSLDEPSYDSNCFGTPIDGPFDTEFALSDLPLDVAPLAVRPGAALRLRGHSDCFRVAATLTWDEDAEANAGSFTVNDARSTEDFDIQLRVPSTAPPGKAFVRVNQSCGAPNDIFADSERVTVTILKP